MSPDRGRSTASCLRHSSVSTAECGRWLRYRLRRRLGICVLDARPVGFSVPCGEGRWRGVGALAAGDHLRSGAGGDVRDRQREAPAEPGALCRRRTAAASIHHAERRRPFRAWDVGRRQRGRTRVSREWRSKSRADRVRRGTHAVLRHRRISAERAIPRRVQRRVSIVAEFFRADEGDVASEVTFTLAQGGALRSPPAFVGRAAIGSRPAHRRSRE